MDALDAARAVLPPWVGWAPLPAAALFAFLAAYAVLWLVQLPARRRLRRTREAHWSARARHAWPARQAGLFCILVLPPLGASFVSGPLPVLFAGPAWSLVAVTALAAFLGAVLAARGLEHEVRPEPRWGVGESVGSRLVTLIIMAPHLLLALPLMVWTPVEWTPSSAGAWGMGMLLLLAVCGYGALPLLWLVRVLRPASPRLLRCMERAAAATGVQPRRVVELRLLPANALAQPMLQTVAVSERALAILSDEELTAVCAHELGHLAEPTSLRAVRWAAAAGVAVPLACGLLLHRAFGPPGFLLALAAMVLVPLLSQRTLSRAEVHADHAAHGAEHGERTYARALERLYRDALLPAVTAARAGVHPPLYERMLAAGVTPDFPRPAPPSRLRGALAIGAVLALAFSAAFAGRVLVELAALEDGADEASLVRAVAWSDETAPLARLAGLREREGRHAEALALIAAAEQREPSCGLYALVRVRLLVETRDCAEALRRAPHAAVGAYGACEAEGDEGPEEAVDAMLEALARCDPQQQAEAR